MNRWLHLVIGSCHILLESAGVREILEAIEPQPNASELTRQRLWREQMLPVIAGHDWLGVLGQARNARRAAIVYQVAAADRPVILECDRVVRVETLTAADFYPLPAYPGAMGRLFDAVWHDAASGCFVLRGRRPLSVEWSSV